MGTAGWVKKSPVKDRVEPPSKSGWWVDALDQSQVSGRSSIPARHQPAKPDRSPWPGAPPTGQGSVEDSSKRVSTRTLSRERPMPLPPRPEFGHCDRKSASSEEKPKCSDQGQRERRCLRNRDSRQFKNFPIARKGQRRASAQIQGSKLISDR
jgi:hypothetical protein